MNGQSHFNVSATSYPTHISPLIGASIPPESSRLLLETPPDTTLSYPLSTNDTVPSLPLSTHCTEHNYTLPSVPSIDSVLAAQFQPLTPPVHSTAPISTHHHHFLFEPITLAYQNNAGDQPFICNTLDKGGTFNEYCDHFQKKKENLSNSEANFSNLDMFLLDDDYDYYGAYDDATATRCNSITPSTIATTSSSNTLSSYTSQIEKVDTYLSPFPPLLTESRIDDRVTSISTKTTRKRGRRPKSEILQQEAVIRQYKQRCDSQRLYEYRAVSELFCAIVLYLKENKKKHRLFPNQTPVFTRHFRSFLHAAILNHPSNKQYVFNMLLTLTDAEIIARHAEFGDEFTKLFLDKQLDQTHHTLQSTQSPTSDSPNPHSAEIISNLYGEITHFDLATIHFLFDDPFSSCPLNITPLLITDILNLIEALDIDFFMSHTPLDQKQPQLAYIDLETVNFNVLVNFAILEGDETVAHINSLIFSAHPAASPPPDSGQLRTRRGRKSRAEIQKKQLDDAKTRATDLRSQRDIMERTVIDIVCAGSTLIYEIPYTRDTRMYMLNSVLHHPYNRRYKAEREKNGPQDDDKNLPVNLNFALLITKEIVYDIFSIIKAQTPIYVSKDLSIDNLIQSDYKHDPFNVFNYFAQDKFAGWNTSDDVDPCVLTMLIASGWGEDSNKVGDLRAGKKRAREWSGDGHDSHDDDGHDGYDDGLDGLDGLDDDDNASDNHNNNNNNFDNIEDNIIIDINKHKKNKNIPVMNTSTEILIKFLLSSISNKSESTSMILDSARVTRSQILSQRLTRFISSAQHENDVMDSEVEFVQNALFELVNDL